jgi:acyl carrier protein phosphodiesterase
MNWLAHIFLSENNVEYQHGNLLADFLKGRSWEHASDAFKSGLKAHHAIDHFTDSHPLVSRSQSRLGKRGYLKGVVIDIVYDHLLANNWHEFSSITYTEFIDRFNRESESTYGSYPENARIFLSRLVASGHLMEYCSFSAVEKSLRRIDTRLSQRVLKHESASDYLPMARIRLSEIEEDFLAFMPELIGHFKTLSDVSQDSHWIK